MNAQDIYINGKKIPTIICLVGSTQFREAYRREFARLTFEGNIVQTCGCFHGDPEWGTAPKGMLDELHKRKIDISDFVFVINLGGYIGDSTRSEIEYAKRTGKLIFYLEEPNEQKS